MMKAVLMYARALKAIGRYKLWSHLLISGLISVLTGILVFGGIYSIGDDVGGFFFKMYPFEWGKAYADDILNWVSRILLWVMAFFTYKYIVLIILSPVMSVVSSKIELHITGKATGKFSIIGELIRGLRFNLRNLMRELFYTALILCLGFVPVVSFAIPVLLFLLQSYYVGLGTMDYYMERHYTLSESITYGKSQRGFLIGIGGAFLLTLFIPIIGFILAPMLSTIASTEKALGQN